MKNPYLRGELQPFDLFVFDLDGVVYRGPEVIPGALETIGALRSAGKRVAFNTNNSSRTREAYVEVLAGLGIEADVTEVFTSAYLVALRLGELTPGGSVFLVGQRGFRDELEGAGFSVVNDSPDVADVVDGVDFVVVGWDNEFDYEKLTLAKWGVDGGAKFIASNDDATLPHPGRDLPGAGTMVAAISTCVGKPPDEVIGKPNPRGLELVSKRFGVPPARSVMVGDRLETDILAGNRAGFFTVFTCETGARTRADLGMFGEADYDPDLVVPSIREFLE
ncbi:MAG: HAD-IIA family hydrolase [Promethearchaeota archaeon]